MIEQETPPDRIKPPTRAAIIARTIARMTPPEPAPTQETVRRKARWTILAYAIARLKEPSTRRGLVLMATAGGATLSPDETELIVATGIGLAGLLAVMLPDSAK